MVGLSPVKIARDQTRWKLITTNYNVTGKASNAQRRVERVRTSFGSRSRRRTSFERARNRCRSTVLPVSRGRIQRRSYPRSPSSLERCVHPIDDQIYRAERAPCRSFDYRGSIRYHQISNANTEQSASDPLTMMSSTCGQHQRDPKSIIHVSNYDAIAVEFRPYSDDSGRRTGWTISIAEGHRAVWTSAGREPQFVESVWHRFF